MSRVEFLKYEDDQRRLHFSTLVHWQLPKGPGHCLMQAVFLPNHELKIFLVSLRTCPHARGIYAHPALAANAAWNVLEGNFSNLHEFQVEWFFRNGPYSYYEYGFDERLSRFNFTKDGAWNYKKYDNVILNRKQIDAIIDLTNVSPAEADLEKLPKMPHPDPRDEY